jgi:hypothetical protein
LAPDFSGNGTLSKTDIFTLNRFVTTPNQVTYGPLPSSLPSGKTSPSCGKPRTTSYMADGCDVVTCQSSLHQYVAIKPKHIHTKWDEVLTIDRDRFKGDTPEMLEQYISTTNHQH